MGKMIELTASDGHKLAAYRADPAGKARGGIVVIQEIFGVNSHIKAVTDGFAADGYVAIAPAMFDRVQRNYDTGYSPQEIEAGRAIFNMRQGQLDLACAQCHDDNRGRKLAGITLTQGHPTGYPLYRLEWQTLGSLQRRLRNCLIGMRAEPYAYGAPEYIALEAYLMWRARGMAVESPAVRP